MSHHDENRALGISFALPTTYLIPSLSSIPPPPSYAPCPSPSFFHFLPVDVPQTFQSERRAKGKDPQREETPFLIRLVIVVPEIIGKTIFGDLMSRRFLLVYSYYIFISISIHSWLLYVCVII